MWLVDTFQNKNAAYVPARSVFYKSSFELVANETVAYYVTFAILTYCIQIIFRTILQFYPPRWQMR